ncbi:MAG: hypothetical protein JXQ90_22140 [Cyclobacteriaceae bacterium]
MSKHSGSYMTLKEKLRSKEVSIKNQIDQDADLAEKQLIQGAKIAAGVLLAIGIGYTAYKLASGSSEKSKKRKKKEKVVADSPIVAEAKSLGMILAKRVAESVATNLIKSFTENFRNEGKSKDS